jgi:8-oxo-dGTP diphosphatase
MPDTPKHSVSVAGIVIDDQDRVLVIRRRDNNHWEPPGGVLELNETFEQGVRREVLEETGVTVTVDRLTGVYKNMNRGIVALVFRCYADNGPRRATGEAAEVRWMDCNEIVDSMDPAYAIRALDAFEGKPRVRAHDGVDLT